jgi:hypothetical protein
MIFINTITAQIDDKKIKIKYDDMRGVTWFYDKKFYRRSNSSTNIHAYIGLNDGDTIPFLRLVIRYNGSGWLFINKYIIKTDDKSYTIYVNTNDIKTKIYSGGFILEKADLYVNNDKLIIIKSIINSEITKIRYVGDNYYYDRFISDKEKLALKNILETYYTLGGEY